MPPGRPLAARARLGLTACGRGQAMPAGRVLGRFLSREDTPLRYLSPGSAVEAQCQAVPFLCRPSAQTGNLP